MTAKERRDFIDNKYHKWAQCRGYCQECGEKMESIEVSQWSHIIPQHKMYLKKYGKELIHHPLNAKLTCSLACNAKVQISPASRPLEAEAHVKKIRQAIVEERR